MAQQSPDPLDLLSFTQIAAKEQRKVQAEAQKLRRACQVESGSLPWPCLSFSFVGYDPISIRMFLACVYR